MKSALKFGAVLLIAASCALAQKENARKVASMPPPPKAAIKNGGYPKAGQKPLLQKQPGAVRPNPAMQFERLLNMPPDQRDRVIEKLPPQQQERLRARLEQFDSLPPAQKAWRLELVNRYFALPPERQQAYQQQLQAFNKLEPRRRRMVGDELKALWALPESDRQARLSDEAYKSRFSPDELQILNTISAANLLKQ
jgi:Protein of unknown function (DUF3106)